MYFPNKEDFLKVAKRGTLVPVFREIIADTETPVSAYSKVSGKYSYLLESVEGGESLARYSIIGFDPYLIFESKGSEIRLSYAKEYKDRTKKINGDPFKVLKGLLNEYKPVKTEGLPRFHGGAVGYIGYDAVRFFENIPDKNPDQLNMPDITMMFSDIILLFDHVKHKILVFSNVRIGEDPSGSYDKATGRISDAIKKLAGPVRIKPLEQVFDSEQACLCSNMSKNEFESCVDKAKEYIRSGDVIQVVLSQRFAIGTKTAPFDLYRSLRTINPSPYMYFFDLGECKLIGSSPEIMVRLEDGTATVRPIAGTAKRGPTAEEDESNERMLLLDEKEKAEHVMLVDLARNDLGRVCVPGSIKVSGFMSVEKYSHVMHIVSNVSGSLEAGKDAFDLFAACFPAGTVSGAPKVRAMEIIDELENVKRGPYAGAVGYFDFKGNLDTCITIRTIIMKGKNAYVQAGAGLVADSVPENEYFESCNKAKALIKAIEAVEK